MINLYKKYEGHILPLILILIFIVVTIFTWGKWGHIIHDCFKEALIPEAILDGKILYKDITSFYPPLAYYLNAALFYIFGNSLNTLYWAGITNSFLILSIIYFLIKKYSSNLTAFIITLSVMEIFTFKMPHTTASWFFPYSYSFIYAFSSCLLGFLAYILYKENSKNKYLFLSFFFAGLSAAFKLDFILFVLLPLFEIIKTKSCKNFFYGAVAYFIPIISGGLIFFITGGNFEILTDEINCLINFSKAPSVIIFNKTILPQSFSIQIFKTALISFVWFLFDFAILYAYAYFCTFLLSKIKNIPLKILSGLGLYVLGYGFLIIGISIFQFSDFAFGKDLAFVSYFITILALTIFILQHKNKITLDEKEKFFFFATFFAILISFRSFALLYTSYIGNFILAIWWCLFVYFFLQLCPKYCPKIFAKNNVKKSFCLSFIIYGLIFAFIYFINQINMPYPIKSKKGTFYTSQGYNYALREGINFIKDTVKPDEVLLVLEEGSIFNYFTNTKTNLKYYAITPHIVGTYKEENIIKDLSNNPPDYIFITNSKYITEAGGYFGIDYAKKIYAYILENYDFIKTIKDPNADFINAGDNFEFNIFKLR